MPTSERVHAFVEAVRAGRFVEAIEDFYTPDATMRDNLGPARGGRDVLVQHEKATLAGVKSIVTRTVGAVLIDGDRVVVNWEFEIAGKDGAARRMDELALQTWRGDRIAEEQFYFDPGQLAVTV